MASNPLSPNGVRKGWTGRRSCYAIITAQFAIPLDWHKPPNVRHRVTKNGVKSSILDYEIFITYPLKFINLLRQQL